MSRWPRYFVALRLLARLSLFAQDPAPQPLRVYLFAGQSNREGNTSAKWVEGHAPELVLHTREAQRGIRADHADWVNDGFIRKGR